MSAETVTFCTARASLASRPLPCQLLADHRGVHRYEWSEFVYDDDGKPLGRVDHRAWWDQKSAIAKAYSEEGAA